MHTGRAARVLAVTHEAPGGEREVRAIEAVWRGGHVRRLEGDAATETVAQHTAADYAVLHFAVHAIADDADPLASHLRLAPDSGSDGLLHSSEIATQSHTGQLVVLSACETQMGRLYHGEGIMSLTRAFLATGATAVVATQWPVGAATADLMTGFYRSLAAGADPATALRTSQRRLRHDARTSHPFYWAGFGLHVGG
jgi:CHAT domain-containing protein